MAQYMVNKTGKAGELEKVMEDMGSLYDNAGIKKKELKTAGMTEFGMMAASGQIEFTSSGGGKGEIVYSKVAVLRPDGISVPAPEAAAEKKPGAKPDIAEKLAKWRGLYDKWLQSGAADALSDAFKAEMADLGLLQGSIPPMLPGLKALGLGSGAMASFALAALGTASQGAFDETLAKLPALISEFETKVKVAKSSDALPSESETKEIERGLALLSDGATLALLKARSGGKKVPEEAAIKELKDRFAAAQKAMAERLKNSKESADLLAQAYQEIIGDVIDLIAPGAKKAPT
jgi:hypothetical protein